ncbi:LysR substrate-binding domain-containing protein, partial [Burkholderia sp. BCC1640]
NGNCELMFAYHHPELPLHLDPARYEHLTVGLDTLLPVSQPTPRAAPRFRLPGTSKAALPLISYTETSYFGRCQALLLSRAPATPMLRLHFESDMAEVLKKLVVEGEGLAWLPRSAIARELAAGELVPAGPAAWQLEVELRVYRDTSNRGAFVDTLWQHLRASV